MKFSGICKSIDRIVVSDSSYKDDVWCRYENKNVNGQNWKVHGFITDYAEQIEGLDVKGQKVVVCLSAPDEYVELHEDGSFASYARTKIKEFTIGMDSACVGFGVNERADEIKARRDEWQPNCCLRTCTDGIFGKVFEGNCDDSTRFIVISGSFDEDTGYSQKDILEYLVSSLNIELERSLTVDELLSGAVERGNSDDTAGRVVVKDDIELD